MIKAANAYCPRGALKTRESDVVELSFADPEFGADRYNSPHIRRPSASLSG